jgi:hypothetical protein
MSGQGMTNALTVGALAWCPGMSSQGLCCQWDRWHSALECKARSSCMLRHTKVKAVGTADGRDDEEREPGADAKHGAHG